MDRRADTLRQPLLGIGDVSVDAVDGPDATNYGSHGAYVGVDIPYGDHHVDGDVKKGGGLGESREMTLTPSQTVHQPFSRLAAMFPSDSLTDPTYMSPYYHGTRCSHDVPCMHVIIADVMIRTLL